MIDMLIVKELVTPELDGSILPGVTRDSILSLTRSWGEFKVSERKFTMKDLVKADKEGRIIEMFGMLHYLVYLVLCLSCLVLCMRRKLLISVTSGKISIARSRAINVFFGICRWHTWACAYLLYFYHGHAHTLGIAYSRRRLIVDIDHGPWTNPLVIYL